MLVDRILYVVRLVTLTVVSALCTQFNVRIEVLMPYIAASCVAMMKRNTETLKSANQIYFRDCTTDTGMSLRYCIWFFEGKIIVMIVWSRSMFLYRSTLCFITDIKTNRSVEVKKENLQEN